MFDIEFQHLELFVDRDYQWFVYILAPVEYELMILDQYPY